MKTLGTIYSVILRITDGYKRFVEQSTMGSVLPEEEDISYWRERLFSKFITYLLPACLFALIPGVVMAFKAGLLFVAYADIVVVVSIAIVALNAGLSLKWKKIFVIALLYLFSIALIIDLSLLGPGIVYLLALSMLVTTIFPRHCGYWTVGANFLICVLCAFVIHFRLFNSPLIKDYGLGAWVAVSSNEVFLSFVIVVVISNTIKGLELVIAKGTLSKELLQEEVARGDKVNAQLKESESHYKSLFFRNPSPMWILDKQTKMFLQVNESAVKQYGYTPEEFLAMQIIDIKVGEEMAQLHNYMEMSEIDDAAITFVTEHRRKSGEHLYAELTFNSILFNGRPATLAISQDITEQMKYVQAIERQNEQLREIAWIQSHKVRGPLATILGLIELFNHDQIEVDTHDIIQGILSSSRQLDTVIKEIVVKSSLADIPTPPGCGAMGR